MKRSPLIDTDAVFTNSNAEAPSKYKGKIHGLTRPNTVITTDYEPWGVEEFDRSFGGLAAGTFNMLATPNSETALVAIGHFLSRGLGDGQRAAVIALDNPRLTLSKLALYGFDYESALQSERLVYLYYTPTFSHALSCSTDYTALFSEIQTLAGPINRLAFLNADLLFNLQTEYLAQASVSKLAAETNSSSITTLGCYVQQHTHSCTLLDAACCGLMPSYLLLRGKPGQHNQHYTLEWCKGPFTSTNGINKLALKLGQGYVKRGPAKHQIA